MFDLQWERIRISAAIQELNGVIQAAQELQRNMPDGSFIDGLDTRLLMPYIRQVMDQATVARKYLLKVQHDLPLLEKEMQKMQTETINLTGEVK